MNTRLFLFLGGGFFFIQFVLFSYLVHKDIFQQLDFDATVRLQDNISTRFDIVFSMLSEVGKFEISLIVLIIIFILTRNILGSLVGIFLFAFFHIIELFGKFFVEHLPPPEFLLRTKHLVDFPQFHVRSEFSYPSGHSGRAAFISIILFILLWQNKKLNLWTKVIFSLIIIFYNSAMYISRVYLGEHWTTDVLGGAMLGVALGLLTGTLLTNSTYKTQK